MGRGDLGGAIGLVLDASPPDLDRAENSLEGERRGAAADDPTSLPAAPSGQDEFGVGLAAFEHLAAAFDARFEASGEVGIVLGHGQFQTDLGLKDQATPLDLDLLGSDRSLKLLRGTHGDVLLWRGGVAMRALLPIPSQFLQIRA